MTVRQFRPAVEQGVLASISGNQRAMTIPGDPEQLLSGILGSNTNTGIAH